MKKLRSGAKHLAPLHEMRHPRSFPLPLVSRLTAHSPQPTKIALPAPPFPPLRSEHSPSPSDLRSSSHYGRPLSSSSGMCVGLRASSQGGTLCLKHCDEDGALCRWREVLGGTRSNSSFYILSSCPCPCSLTLLPQGQCGSAWKSTSPPRTSPSL